MTTIDWAGSAALVPAVLMGVAAMGGTLQRLGTQLRWQIFQALSWIAVAMALFALVAMPAVATADHAWLRPDRTGLVLALLVQALGTVIGAFSSRYLEGEAGQRGYVVAFAVVLGAVQLMLLANHWLVLVPAWALVGIALRRLLCFYPERPFALLAAHKKQIADRAADLLLVVAAVLAWREVGSGSFTVLWEHVARHGASTALQVAAVCVAGAAMLRSALFPVHGWLIQVMEAPTPVSALLHAGVVNLGGAVLIRFAPLLAEAPFARWTLVAAGLATAILAGMVMLTRVSIKVRLAWSTVAQMGFMLLECGLGLYTLALLHLLGHSLYKAHAFLSASSIVRESRLRGLHAPGAPTAASLWLAPIVATVLVVLVAAAIARGAGNAWPLWWSILLGFAWAPLLWRQAGAAGRVSTSIAGAVALCALTALAALAHHLPFGVTDAPHDAAGIVAATGMAGLYLAVVLVHLRPAAMAGWRRWSYAGFHVDAFFTRLTLRLWPAAWATHSPRVAYAGAQDDRRTP